MIIEHVSFTLRGDVDQERFREADRRVQEQDAPFRVGFVRRTTASSSDGSARWLVETLWWGVDECEQAWSESAAVAAMIELAAPGTVERTLWETLD